MCGCARGLVCLSVCVYGCVCVWVCAWVGLFECVCLSVCMILFQKGADRLARTHATVSLREKLIVV